MGQNKVVIDVKQRQLLSQARFALAERIDPAPERRHPLTDIEVEALHKGRLDRPATGSQDLLHGQLGAEHHIVFDPYEAPTTPELTLKTNEEEPEESASRVIEKLEFFGYLWPRKAQETEYNWSST